MNEFIDRGGPKPKHVVYALLGESGKIAFISSRRNDRPRQWETVFWRLRNEIDVPLCRWFKTLDRMPEEKILIGAAVGLHAAAARQIAEMLRKIIPDTVQPGKTPGRRRPVGKLRNDGGLDVFQSQAAAGRALGLTRGTVRRAVLRGRLLDLTEGI